MGLCASKTIKEKTMNSNDIEKVREEVEEICENSNSELSNFLMVAHNMPEDMNPKLLKVFINALAELHNAKTTREEDETHENNLKILEKNNKFWEMQNDLEEYVISYYNTKSSLKCASEILINKYLGENNEQ